MKQFYWWVTLLGLTSIYAQTPRDSVFILDEVRVSDRVYKRYNQTQHVQTLAQKRIMEYRSSLAGSIASQTLVHVRENGMGGVSSPSFRGTTAQHTALVWNGLQINSTFNGQADFSLLSPWDYSQVEVKSGGGSVLYGSGAIGGSIHLNQTLGFDQKPVHLFRVSGGSFGQQSSAYRFKTGSDRWAIETGLSYLAETNDFKRLDNGRINENGEHEHYQFNLASGYRLAKHHWLKGYFTWNETERNFSLMTPTDTRTAMDNREVRSLLEWQYQTDQWLSKLRAGYLHEHYDYFENAQLPSSDFGTSSTALAQYQLERNWNKRTQIQVQLNGSKMWGEGSMVREAQLENIHASLQVSYAFTDALRAEAGIRQDAYSDYDAPFLYSAGLNYGLTDDLHWRISGSKNYRVPTLNDLYWRTGGSPSIQPETALQWETGLAYQIGLLRLDLTYYANQVENLIQWQPGQSSQWSVGNVNEVAIQGLEFRADIGWEWGEFRFGYTGQLGYTSSENAATHRQLIYTPKWKHVHRFAVDYRQWNAYVHAVAVGEQFIRSDNNPLYVLDAYQTFDAGIRYAYAGKIPFTIGVQLRNLTDQLYYAMERRPYPGRHFSLQLQFEL